MSFNSKIHLKYNPWERHYNSLRESDTFYLCFPHAKTTSIFYKANFLCSGLNHSYIQRHSWGAQVNWKKKLSEIYCKSFDLCKETKIFLSSTKESRIICYLTQQNNSLSLTITQTGTSLSGQDEVTVNPSKYLYSAPRVNQHKVTSS